MKIDSSDIKSTLGKILWADLNVMLHSQHENFEIEGVEDLYCVHTSIVGNGNTIIERNTFETMDEVLDYITVTSDDFENIKMRIVNGREHQKEI